MFDILPLSGVLQPHSSHQISFTFYGHCDIIAQAKALCEVEGGPTYEIILKGEASLVSYSFDTKDINYGLQVLQTTGWGFSDFALNMDHSPCPQMSSEPSCTSQSHHHPCPQSLTAFLLLIILLLLTVCQTFSLLFSPSSETQCDRHSSFNPEVCSNLSVSFIGTSIFSHPLVSSPGLFHCPLPYSIQH
jgi:hypothetical protein